ncbi:hypothetical protein AAFN88_10305 [Pelagibius sp. CAU 1746]|uniref:hypothetical protein n=1 Tax=Pelagibius sp. CAU 1746 TaxID=3140370 RepID=UPI00325B9956
MDTLPPPAFDLTPPDISGWRRGDDSSNLPGPGHVTPDYVHSFDFGVAGHGIDCTPAPQRVIEVTDRVTAASNDFTFVRPFRGMDVLAQAGTVIALDRGAPVVTPYDNCILVMPVAHPQAGATAVRLGREVG